MERKAAKRARATSHVIVETTLGEFFIVSSLSGRADTQLIAIEPRTGALRYRHQPQLDLFDSAEDALNHVTVTMGRFVKSQLVVVAVLGYVVVEGLGALLVATKVTPESAFFGGHTVCTVTESQWLRIPLSSCASPRKAEVKNLELLSSFPLDGLHFYCETYDFTRPFPSTSAVHNYVQEFCWNDWLTTRFAKAGLREWCPVLLQGMARARFVPGINASMSLVCKKSNLNPGTRFYARGLNEAGGTGNEMECELLVWTGEAPEVRWASFVWRRGTVPVWWKGQPRGVGDAEITVRKDKPFEGSELYFSSLVQQYGQPIYALSLLRTEPTREEMVLCESYQLALRYVRRWLNVEAHLINYDWHCLMKQLGTERAIEGLWAQLAHPLERINCSSGVAVMSGGDGSGSGADDRCGMACPGGLRAVFQGTARQTGLLRINCADSLDRTNVASFFICFQVVAELCRKLNCSGFRSISEGEKRWSHFACNLQAMSQILRSSGILETLADFFVYNGDICSILYTNSCAAHSGPLRDYSPNTSSAPINAIIAIQRRYQNILHDHFRQAQYEMFTGVNRLKHLPTVEACDVDLVSDAPSWVVQAPAAADPAQQRSADALLLHAPDSGPSAPFWPTPAGCERTELAVFLRCPCDVCEVGLVVAGDPGAQPTYLDVQVGPYLNALRVALQNVRLPQCAAGTQLRFALPPNCVWDFVDERVDAAPAAAQQPPPQGPRPWFARFVVVALRTPGAARGMAVGRVEVYGRVPKAERTPALSAAALKVRDIEERAKVLSAVIAAQQSSASPLSPPTSPGGGGGVGGPASPPSSASPPPGPALAEQAQQQQGARRRSWGAGGATLPAGAEAQQQQREQQERVSRYEEALIGKLLQAAPTYTACLELEAMRCEARLTALDRDAALHKLGIAIHDANPSRFVYPRQDRIEAALLRARPAPHRCAACGEPFGVVFQRPDACRYCRARLCAACMAPQPAPIPEFMWERPQPVCRRCAAELQAQALLAERLKRLAEEERLLPPCAAPQCPPLQQPVVVEAQIANACAGVACELEALRREGNLAEYPGAALAQSVPCAADSSPAEILLVPHGVVPVSSAWWRAPDGVRAVAVTVALPYESIVTAVGLVADAAGYTAGDAPHVTVSLGPTLAGLQEACSWSVCSAAHAGHAAASSPSDAGGGVEGLVAQGEELLVRDLPQTARCRVVSLLLRLPDWPADNAFLHAARVVINGTCLAVPDAMPSATPSAAAAMAAMAAGEGAGAPKREVIEPNYVETHMQKSRGWVGLEFLPASGPRMLRGFQVKVRHSDEGGVASQARLLRISSVTYDTKGEATGFYYVGKLVLPKCAPGTTLWYPFQGVLQCNVINFEVLCTYGGELAPLKIAVF
eukprot:m51a1_g3690 putative probable phosphoinositide phosphatase sac9-like (1382) ;mRNA; r:344780-350053